MTVVLLRASYHAGFTARWGLHSSTLRRASLSGDDVRAVWELDQEVMTEVSGVRKGKKTGGRL